MPRLPADTSIRRGVRLADYSSHDVTVERVSRGGFGVVAFGRNPLRQNRMEALKTLHHLLLRDANTRDRFVEECLLWVGLWDHPNVVGVYGVTTMGDETGPNRPYIALHYAEHGSLREKLGIGQPLSVRLAWAQCIAAGLDYLHTPDPKYLRHQPTVHRDLKPENVLIMGNGLAAITDFGLAKAIAESRDAAALLALFSEADDADEIGTTPTRTIRTRAGDLLGTPEYMAPEQWTDPRAAGTPADIYALGIMLSELLAGRHALLDMTRRHSTDDWRRAHEHPHPRSLREVAREVPEEAETIYRQCLAEHPNQRPTAKAVLTALQAAARRAGTQVYEPFEIAKHTPENELAHWHNWAAAYARFGEQAVKAGRAPEGQRLLAAGLIRSDRALALAPHDPGALTVHGGILQQLGRNDEAEQLYKRAIDEYPENDKWSRAGVWHNLGNLYGRIERYAEADLAYDQATTLVPGFTDSIHNRGANQGHWALAEEQAGRREGAAAHLRLARVYMVTALSLGDASVRQLLEIIERELARLGAE